MVARAAIESHRQRQAVLAQSVRRVVSGALASVDLTQPAAARDALIRVVPEVVQRFGPVSAQIAADWYDQLRRDDGARGSFRARPAEGSVTADQVAAQVRYRAGVLWTPRPGDILEPLTSDVAKYVRQYGRDTIASNAQREGVRWARVPTGAKTCSWCLVLASRDAVYLSERSASQTEDGGKYHGDCDCEAVRIAKESDYPPGYLPDDYYAMYQAAVQEADSGSIEDVAAAFRRLHPDAVTDGVVPKD